jgi:Spy/CpxP family protein refolding chaperone
MKEMMMQKMIRNILASTLLTTMPIFTFACEGPMGSPQDLGAMPLPSHMMSGVPNIVMAGLPQMLGDLAGLKELDLSDVQQKNIFDVIYGQLPAIFENDRISHNTMRDIHQLGMSDKFDADKAKSLTDEHSKAMSRLIYMRAEIESKIWTILTNQQRKRLIERMRPPPHQ